jgi:hypothetical protein
MAWIRIIDEDEADEKSRLGKLYAGCKEAETGQVDNILKIHSLRPETMSAHVLMYRTAMMPHRGEGLSRREREVIAVLVSAANECHY